MLLNNVYDEIRVERKRLRELEDFVIEENRKMNARVKEVEAWKAQTKYEMESCRESSLSRDCV